MWGCFAGATRKTPPHTSTIIEIPREPVLKALHDWLGEDIREKRKAHIKIGYNIGRAP